MKIVRAIGQQEALTLFCKVNSYFFLFSLLEFTEVDDIQKNRRKGPKIEFFLGRECGGCCNVRFFDKQSIPSDVGQGYKSLYHDFLKAIFDSINLFILELLASLLAVAKLQLEIIATIC